MDSKKFLFGYALHVMFSTRASMQSGHDSFVLFIFPMSMLEHFFI